MIWSDLVANSPRLAVTPQYRLWYIDPDDSSLSDDNVADKAPVDQGDLTFLSLASDEGEDAAVISVRVNFACGFATGALRKV